MLVVCGGADESISDTILVSPRDPVAKLTLRLGQTRGIRLDVTYPEGCEKTLVRAAVLLIDAQRPPAVANFARAAKWLAHLKTDALYPSVGRGMYGALESDLRRCHELVMHSAAF